MDCVQDIRDMTIEAIEDVIAPFITERTYLKARSLCREVLEKLYGLNHMILLYDEVLKSWTWKVGRILSNLVNDGILTIYSRNSRGRLYKKIKEKE